MLLHVSVCTRNSNFTHQRRLQYSALLLLPRIHRIDTAEVALRDHGNCEHSCVVYSSLSTAIFSQYACLASRKVLDPLQWWDHRSEKVTEHQTCQSSHVNVATLAALFGVNLVAFSLSLSWLLSILPWSKLGRNSFQVLCTGGIVVAVGSRR